MGPWPDFSSVSATDGVLCFDINTAKSDPSKLLSHTKHSKMKFVKVIGLYMVNVHVDGDVEEM